MTKIAVLALAVALLGGASTARADNPQLTGNVGLGDSFTISLAGPDGKPVQNLDPGTYTLLVHDHSAIHNFHLFGPGSVDVSTTIEAVGDQTFTVTLVPGTYTFTCDAHPSMTGRFTVGAASTTTTTTGKPAPKPKPKHKKKPKPKKKR
jgi:hypothetical protein